MSTSSPRPQVAPESRARNRSSVAVVATVLAAALAVTCVPDAAAGAPQRKPPGDVRPAGGAKLRNAPSTPTTPIPPPDGSAVTPNIFDPTELQVIELTMKPGDWDALSLTADNTYYPADVKWKSNQAANIGVRSRGSGSRSKDKPGLRLDFNRYRDQTFVGLKSVVLVNGVQDTSMMRQRLAFAAYARMGVPAPQSVHAKLYVNGNYLGLYQLVESVDKVMLPRVFDESKSNKEDDGYLYEYKWLDYYFWTYLGADLRTYADRFEPQTHELEAPADLYGPIEQLIGTTNSSSDGEFESRMGDFFDLKSLAKFLAVENFFTDGDGFLGDWGVNNFYLYRFESGKKWALLPWDKDLAFYDATFDIFRHVDQNVLASRLLKIPSVYAAYLDTMTACAAMVVEPYSKDSPTGWFEGEVLREAAQVREAVYSDRHKPYPDSDFDEAMLRLPSFGKTRAAFVLEAVAKARAARQSGR